MIELVPTMSWKDTAHADFSDLTPEELAALTEYEVTVLMTGFLSGQLLWQEGDEYGKLIAAGRTVAAAELVAAFPGGAYIERGWVMLSPDSIAGFTQVVRAWEHVTKAEALRRLSLP